MKYRLVKTQFDYIPATDEDKIKADKVEVGEIVEVRSLDQRSASFHRRFFKMIAVAWDNLPHEFEDRFPRQLDPPDEFRYELIKRAGYYMTYTDFKGNTQHVAKSIAFDKMGQEEFEKLSSAVLDVIISWLMPDADRDLLEHEIINFA